MRALRGEGRPEDAPEQGEEGDRHPGAQICADGEQHLKKISSDQSVSRKTRSGLRRRVMSRPTTAAPIMAMVRMATISPGWFSGVLISIISK